MIDVPVESKFTTLNKEIKEKGVVKDIDKEIAEAITKVETEPVSTESSTTTIAESVPMVVPDTTTMVTQAPETSTPYIETTIPEDTTTEYDIDTEDGPVKPSAPPPSALEFVSVCFDYNGGKPIYDDTYEMSCVVGSYMGYLPVAEREYYIFDGWWTVDSSGCYAVQYTTHTVVTESVTLVARWKEI